MIEFHTEDDTKNGVSPKGHTVSYVHRKSVFY